MYGSAFGLAAILMLFGLHAVLRTYGTNRLVFGPAQRVTVLTTSVLAPVVLPALQSEFWFEHLALAVTAAATVGVAASSWMGR